MPNGEQPLAPPPAGGLNKRDLIITAIAVFLAIVIIIFLLRALTRAPEATKTAVTSPGVTSVSAPVVPVTAGLQPWRGAVTLTVGDATFVSGGNNYILFIKAPGASSKILKDQGYKDGDQINVIGKIVGNYLEVAGVSK